MEIASVVDEVLVWRRGATVTRRSAPVALTGQGPRLIRLPGLPVALSDGSVRIAVDSLQGDGEVRITGVRVMLHAAPRSEVPPEPDVQRLKEATRQLLRARRTLALVSQERALLQSIEVPERPDGEEGKPPPASPMYARVALDGFVDEGAAARDSEALALSREIERLTEEVAALTDAVRRRDAAMRARPEEVTKAVVATLETTGQPGSVRLLLRYDVPGARWAPVYQIHVEGQGSRARLAMRAVVAQATGEAWRSVKLTLSTALPESFNELPVLKALRIGKAQPPPAPAPAFRAPPAGAERLFADFDREASQLLAWKPAPRLSRQAPALPALPELDLDLPDLEMDEMDEMEMERERGISFDGEGESYEKADVDARPLSRSAPMLDAAALAPKPQLREERAKGGARRAPPAPQARKRVAKKAEMAVEEEESLPLDDDGESPRAGKLPAFASLRLPEPTSPERGKLQRQSTPELWLSGLDRPVAFDVLSWVSSAQSRADAVLSLPMPVGTAPVEHSTGHFDHAWRAEDRLDLPSDGGWHTVPVATREGSCSLRYVVVPRQDVSVFRVATLPNPLSSPLLTGPVEVYVDGAFQLTGQLPTVAPGETVELGMGVEPAIRCARNTAFEEKRSGERVVAMTELHHTVKIDLRNGLTREVPVEVRERIPQPARDAEVAIDEEAVEPPWEPYAQRERQAPVKGGRRWKIALPAQGTASLSARYVVRIYANNEVVGGNRREA